MRGSSTSAPSGLVASSNRRQPARSARSTATRPSNYYARPLSYQNNPSAPTDDNGLRANPPGFFPAITHFTDGLSALPKEVMRHFTLIKETEGKAYLPDQAIAEILDSISKLPDPPREPPKQHFHPYMGFSLNNSVNGSAPGSVVDGNLPATQQSLPEAEDRPQVINEQLEVRRLCFSKLRDNIRAMLNVLDEKNMVLTSANDTLARSLARLDGTLPHLEGEISEEARLGSNTHWALPHMREMRKANGSGGTGGSRRDVQAANNLAAAAAAIHEGDIAATRSEARREALQAKRRHNVDSDLDDRPPPKRAPAGAKSRKAQEAAGAADGKAAGGPQPPKRRRIEKSGAPAMERTASGATTGKAAAASHRDREGAGEGPVRKKNKALATATAGRKRNAPGSPSITSSPTRGTFPTATQKDFAPTSAAARGANSRGRQNSAMSAKSSGADATRNRPPSAASSVGPPNGPAVGTTELKSVANVTGRSLADSRSAVSNVNPTADGEVALEAQGLQGALVVESSAPTGSLKREETEPADGVEISAAAQNSRSEASNKPGSRASKPGTPVEAAGATSEGIGATGMARSRSTRGLNGNGAAAGTGPAAANSPATRAADDTAAPRRTQKKTAKATAESVLSSPSPAVGETLATTTSNQRRANTNGSRGEVVAPIDEEEASLAAGDDGWVSSDEPRYCICNGPSYGHMIGCDNEDCPREWFHMACVGIAKLPGPRTKWYCEECRENMKGKEQLRRR